MSTRGEAFAVAVEYLDRNGIRGAVVELGVHRGASLAQLARLAPERRVVGVDSFAGLPAPSEHDSAQFAEGQFGSSPDRVIATLRGAGVDPLRVELLCGFFASVPTTPEVALVHLDCDLYQSGLDGLRCVDPVDGAVVLIDDYYCHRANPRLGVRRAWAEWLAEMGREATDFWRYAWHGRAFVVHERVV